MHDDDKDRMILDWTSRFDNVNGHIYICRNVEMS